MPHQRELCLILTSPQSISVKCWQNVSLAALFWPPMVYSRSLIMRRPEEMRSNGERQVNRLTKWPSNCVSKPSIKEAPTMSAVWCFIWNDSERLSKHLHRIILIYTTSYVNRQNPDRQDLLTFSSLLCDTLLYIIYIFFLCNLLQTNQSSFTRQTKGKSDKSRCAR